MNEALQLIHDLVAIKSPSRDEDQAVSFLIEAMDIRGMRAYRDEAGNAVGVRECLSSAGTIEREIMMLGHIDTVPGDIPVEVQGGKLFGRGSVDAKGPLATFVMAATQVELQPGTRLVVVGAVEEEAATSKGARQVVQDFRPDFCLIGEPSGADALTLGYKGRMLLDYELALPAGHTAGPTQAAPEIAIGWWQQIQSHAQQFNEDKRRLFDQLLPSVCSICTVSDGLTETVKMTVGLRLPPDFSAEPFIQAAREWAGEAQIRSYAIEPAYAQNRNNPLVHAFNHVWRQAGQRPRYKLKTGTSDMNVVAPIWRCPTVAYGPGDSKLDHTPNEHLDLGEYKQAINILTQVLQRLQT